MERLNPPEISALPVATSAMLLCGTIPNKGLNINGQGSQIGSNSNAVAPAFTLNCWDAVPKFGNEPEDYYLLLNKCRCHAIVVLLVLALLRGCSWTSAQCHACCNLASGFWLHCRSSCCPGTWHGYISFITIRYTTPPDPPRSITKKRVPSW